MNTTEKPYFFRPRIGKHYEEGFRGKKTLVVGAYHYCWESYAARYGCTYRDSCINGKQTKGLDGICPVYRDRRDAFDGYYRISNSNIIEIDSYIEGEHYPIYQAFTYYMTGKGGHILSEKEREAFWESVAFYNYIQHFLPEAQEFSYEDRKEELNADFPAFIQIIRELKPSVIYIWNDTIKNAVHANCNQLHDVELKFYSREIVGSTTVWTIIANYQDENLDTDINALLAEASLLWFCNADKKDIACNILQTILSYRKHEYRPDTVRNLPDKIQSDIQDRLQPVIYDDKAITALTDLYQQASGLNSLISQQEKNIDMLTKKAGHIYSNFLYKEAIPVTGLDPQWLTLWKSPQSADITRLDRTMNTDDILLIWISNDTPWSLIQCEKVFGILRKGLWKMLVLMQSDMNSQYFKTFKESGNVSAIYEAGDSLIIEFSPGLQGNVTMYPDNTCIPYSRFTMLTPSKYLKNKVSRTRFRKFLNIQMKLTDEKLLNILDKILYDAQNAGTIFVQNVNDSLCIRCEDNNSDKTVELIARIRETVKKYAKYSNCMTYEDIQGMLNTDIRNIRKRISDLNKSRTKRRTTQR